ncbi:PA14 domain-containing protein [Bdellovibrio sp. HCB274]|uniref:PA14 domain-containing protein n=1 Tax=Bdellovibrio sp. HCB274 TaxID=3394361 RepID=UPI0039B4271C
MKKTAALLVATLACSPAHALSLGDILKALFSPPAKQEVRAPASSNSNSNSKSNSSGGKNQQQSLEELRKTLGLLKRISCTYHGSNYGVDPNAVFEFPNPEQTVCDPLSNTPSESPTNGLAAKLYVRSAEMTSVSSVMDYYNKGVRMEQDLYFASINVPTRVFTKGFTTEGGSTLSDSAGNKLIEHFAVEYNSILKLSDTDKEGEYELGLISDDGARVFFKENEQWKELINNDGNHASRFGCSYRTLSMKKDTEVPIKVLYYQGPRYHISNVLMWKHHKDVKSFQKSIRDNWVCGKSGNELFYKSKTEKPTGVTKWLQSTGWNTIANANYKMPEHKPNPCVEEKLTVTDLIASSVQAPRATFTWKTNIPATSQLKITNFFTGEVLYTEINNDLVVNHEVQLDGLVSGLYYLINAISTDAQGNQVISSPDLLITP